MDAPEVNRRFLRWLDTRPQRPFFVFLNYMEMHEPYNPPQLYASKFLEDFRPKGFIPQFGGQRTPRCRGKVHYGW